MKFELHQSSNVSGLKDTAILVHSNWDDWFKFETTYALIIFDSTGKRIEAGQLKIGIYDQKDRKPPVPESFPDLGDKFFSVGQDENYYETIYSLGEGTRSKIFKALQDCAFDLTIFEKAKNQYVMTESLLRFIRAQTVTERFHQLANGKSNLTKFQFSYDLPAPHEDIPPLSLSFSVEPTSNPPTNIQVIIGRNGVGKTRCFRLMTQALGGSDEKQVGKFNSQPNNQDSPFANLVSVAFSAFDPFDPPPDGLMGTGKIKYAYVGLRKPKLKTNAENISSAPPTAQPPKTPEELLSEFVSSLARCSYGPRAERWREAIRTLASDPIFEDAKVVELLNENSNFDQGHAAYTFDLLSSGHKIVLLTITRLIELVDERTLVLIDEPESHLHPPLLAAFIRALSYLLVNRNGVAIIATHSPVILQEVPKNCAWFMARSGKITTAQRPEIETFGENVGILTREVFGLEITHSGFHKLLIEQAAKVKSYEELLGVFNGQLGAEARALARTLMKD